MSHSKASPLAVRKPQSVAGTAVAQLGDEFVLVRVKKPRPHATPARPDDSAKTLMGKAGKALNKPGLPKASVFTGSKRIYAYSIDPSDPTRLIRESPDGERQTVRLVNGRFVAKA
ncbi:MAG: hypothetical protein RLZZ584_4263 [Pseudomonadota bacterium]|jgi:hypothetical protein